MSSTPTPGPDGSGWFEIRLTGRLDPRWSARFAGMTMTTHDGTTLLEGHVVDQAALHGLLQQLRDVGLPLVSVTRVDHSSATPPPVPDISGPGA